jgi:hypothetical protein
MKILLVSALLSCSLLGCQKQIQEIEEDLVIQAMTSGQWKMSAFVQNGSDRTADFIAFRFRYNRDYTVDAIRNGIIEQRGTWNGSASTRTISANFPNPINPIDLVNGNWSITRSGASYVEATQSLNGIQKTIRLDKE